MAKYIVRGRKLTGELWQWSWLDANFINSHFWKSQIYTKLQQNANVTLPDSIIYDFYNIVEVSNYLETLYQI